MPSIINATTTNGLVTSADNSGSLQLQTNSGTTAVTINTAQGVSVLNCLGVGNATPSTSGAGITFPATQSASTDANTLDDYEEGTFTPTAFGTTTTGTTTYTLQEGRYTKIGRVVTITFRVTYTSATGTGTLQIGGLPFTIGSQVTGTPMTSDLNWGNSGSLVIYGNASSTVSLWVISNNAAWNTVSISNETADLIGQVTYIV